MKMLKRFITTSVTFLWLFTFASSPAMQAASLRQDKPRLQKNSVTDTDRNQRLQNMLAAAVRHQLMTLPYYDVFDWLEAELLSDGTVILRGEVVRPTTSDDAEKRIRKIESVSRVVNEIKVLPVSSRDNDLRIALYRAIYNWDSALFRYAMRAMPPIHIVVDNGRVTLKGAVGSQIESQLAHTAARHVPGIFEVKNELRVDN
jgi:hyperosmotically inducible protein